MEDLRPRGGCGELEAMMNGCSPDQQQDAERTKSDSDPMGLAVVDSYLILWRGDHGSQALIRLASSGVFCTGLSATESRFATGW